VADAGVLEEYAVSMFRVEICEFMNRFEYKKS
jgi:hypothetical protein